MSNNEFLLTVIPIVVPVGSGDGFRELFDDIRLIIEQISSYVGFDVIL